MAPSDFFGVPGLIVENGQRCVLILPRTLGVTTKYEVKVSIVTFTGIYSSEYGVWVRYL